MLKKRKLSIEKIRNYSDITRLPIITKEMLRASFPDGVVSPHLKRRGKVFQTAGSSGQPFRFFYDKSASAISIATRFLLDSWLGVPPGHKQMAVRIFHTWADRLILNEVNLSPFDISSATVPSIISTLNREQPHVLGGHPSALGLIANEIRQDTCELSFKLKAGFTTAETLLPGLRSRLESAFHAPFFDRYGASEINSYVGQECEHKSGLHIVPQMVLVEVVNGSDHVAPGEKGKLLVTNLTNYVSPLIRYEIGDEAVLGEECPCGRTFPMLKQIVGRTVDYVKTKSGALRPLPDFHIPLTAWDSVLQYEFVQVHQGELTVLIVPGKNFDSRLEAKILKYLAGCAADVDYRIELVSEIPPTRAGKRPALRID